MIALARAALSLSAGLLVMAVLGRHALAIPAPRPPELFELVVADGVTPTSIAWVLDCGALLMHGSCTYQGTATFEITAPLGFVPHVGNPASALLDDVTLPLDGAVTLAPGTHRLVVRGERSIGEDYQYLWVLPARAARHPWLASGNNGRRWSLNVGVPGGVPTTVVVHGLGGADDLTLSSSLHVEEQGTSASVRSDGAPIDLQLSADDELVRLGGIILGLGAAHGDFRMRLGFEVGLGELFLAGLTADTDFDEVVVLSPRVEIATPAFLILPTLAAGAGLALRIGPETEVGVRLLASIQFFALGFVATFDLYPGRDHDIGEISLMARITF